jgi:hypothetical protein
VQLIEQYYDEEVDDVVSKSGGAEEADLLNEHDAEKIA